MFDFIDPHDGPVVVGLEQFETVYAKDQPQYRPLRTLPGRNGDSAIARLSPTDAQRKAIAEGADLYLELLHFRGPLAPSLLMVMSEPPDSDTFRAWWRAQTGGTYPVEPVAKPTDAPVNGVRDRITKIVVDHLGVEAERVTDNAGFIDDLGADSLDQIELVMSFEEEFGIEIPDDELLSILTVGQAIAYVEKKVGGRG